MRKILLLRFSSLGDIIMTTAMIRAVRRRFPGARIDMVVRADFIDLIGNNPNIDTKIGLARASGLRGLWALRRRINAEGYDVIYDAHRSLRTWLLMPFLRAGTKFYYRKHYLRRTLALLFKLPLLRHSPRFLEKFVEPLYPLGVRYDGGGPEMFIDSTAERSAVDKASLPSGDRIVIGIIASAQWPGKRWPADSFRQVVGSLLQATSCDIVVFGGRDDDFCSLICAEYPPDRVFNVQGKLTLAESAAVLARCRLVIANDTGLMHVADALNIPCVLIFGPTSAELGCLPFHPLSEIVEHSLWCRPCSKNGEAPCIRGKRVCLELTTPDLVKAAALRLLERVRSGSPA